MWDVSGSLRGPVRVLEGTRAGIAWDLEEKVQGGNFLFHGVVCVSQ